MVFVAWSRMSSSWLPHWEDCNATVSSRQAFRVSHAVRVSIVNCIISQKDFPFYDDLTRKVFYTFKDLG